MDKTSFPISKKLKLGNDLSIKLLQYESERISTTFKCYDEKDIYKNKNIEIDGCLQSMNRDQDADTTESDKELGVKKNFRELMQALDKYKDKCDRNKENSRRRGSIMFIEKH